MKHHSFDESTEMYLKTVSELAQFGGAPVPISALAERLGVSAVAATEMVHRLEANGLVEHTRYKGIALTAAGERRARGVIRSHHLWECLLVDKLGIPWEAAHEQACRLEHVTEASVREALAEFLGQPERCPHGNPIPTAAGEMPEPRRGRPLASLAAGESATITAIYPESTLLLEYLAPLELRPGQPISLAEIAPFHGPYMVRVGQKTVALGAEAAAQIYVTAVNERDEDERDGEPAAAAAVAG